LSSRFFYPAKFSHFTGLIAAGTIHLSDRNKRGSILAGFCLSDILGANVY
jgi:hypothetical protein